MPYDLRGHLLEVCTCKILCPCWVGEDPDMGTCDSIKSWHIQSGTVDGLDVSGLTVAYLDHIPGNVLKGNWKMVVFVDDRATPAQHDALVRVFTGKAGGPIGDLSQLFGEIVAIEKAPIKVDVTEGKGKIEIGDSIAAEMAPYTGMTGRVTTLHDTAFSTIPGAPAYVSKAKYFRAKNAAMGFDIDLKDHNSIQGEFHFKT